MNDSYIKTVQLLLEVAPVIFDTPVFAMKGGTALNLFVQDMPRLSVDIDVVFLPYASTRDEALRTIANELHAAKDRMEGLGLNALIKKTRDGNEAKMFVNDGVSEVKVEVNFVFRGSVLPPVNSSLTQSAQDLFTANIEVPVLATPELYGSKLVAAMDRQHPRDLYDAQLMFERFGLPEDFIDCFVVYLAGHNRPIHEVLFPNQQPIDILFEAEFAGMTTAPVSLDELKATRQKLIHDLPRLLTKRHTDFLLSLAQAEPDWSLVPYHYIQQLPAIQWKLKNLVALKKNTEKFTRQYAELSERLSCR